MTWIVCCWQVMSFRDEEAETQLLAGLPFIELKIVEDEEFAFFAGSVFATDRFKVPKGLIEVPL